VFSVLPNRDDAGAAGSSRWKVRRQFHIIFAALSVTVHAISFLEALSQPNTGATTVLVNELNPDDAHGCGD
jgi:hypothetical protein